MKTWLKKTWLSLTGKATLPKGVNSGRNFSAEEVLERYIGEPESFWRGVGIRHAAKVVKAANAFAKAGIERPDRLSRRLLTHVRNHRDRFFRPFFVMGAGGSGSTWLGAMLGDFSNFRYGGEIYIPTGMLYLYQRFRNQEAKDLIWSVMMLHAWGLTDPEADFEYEFVNSARSIFSYDILKEIWPAGRFVYLIRDPRDQILSVTYRKMKYRGELKPGISDRSYLLYNAKKNAKINREFKRIENSSICITKYEDLKQDTVGELKKIVDYFLLDIADPEIVSAVYRNSAENMRSGKVKMRGNLDEGGVARHWKNILSDKDKKLIKPIVGKILLELGYETDNRW